MKADRWKFQIALAESNDDPALRIGAVFAAIAIRSQAGDMADLLRWSQTAIEWADGDPTKGNLIVGSPLAVALAFRGVARWWLGRPGWREDLREAVAIARNADATTLAFAVAWSYGLGITAGVLRPDDAALCDLEQALKIAEASGDDNALGSVKYVLAAALLYRNSEGDRERRLSMVTEVRDMCLHRRFPMSELPIIDLCVAWDRARSGDRDGAIPAMRQSAEDLHIRGQFMSCVAATAVLVETLLDQANESDLTEAETAIDRLAAVTGGGWIARDIMVLRLRVLLSRAHGDDAAYRDYRDRYRDIATSLGYEGHIDWAEAMT